MALNAQQRAMCIKLLDLFTLEGRKAGEIATEGEIEIFYVIVFRPAQRAQILCSTQYGKSLFVALALIIVSCIQGELACVVAPSNEKAKIIMRYYVEHLGDNVLFFSQLEKNTKLERLKMEESKDRIVLRNGGGAYVLSAQAKDSRKGFESALGAGARIVITDESSLLPDAIESTIFRMIAGKTDGFYCKIGNPFYRNHFFDSWHDPAYYKVFIDYHQALIEGRYTQAFIEEAKKKPYFDVLYACKFPSDTEVDRTGYRRLLADEEIEKAIAYDTPFGEKRIGNDVAEGGGDSNTFILRHANFATVLLEYQTEDTMDVVTKGAQFIKEEDLVEQNYWIDAIGVGKGAYDQFRAQKIQVSEFKASHEPDDPVTFLNKRAECYWRLRTWVKNGGKLDPKFESSWWELQHIKYKTAPGTDKIKMKSKEEMADEGVPSPNVADGLSFTFARVSVLKKQKTKEQRDLEKQFDANTNKGKGAFKLTGARRF